MEIIMSVLKKRNGRYSLRFTRTVDGDREQKEVGLRTNKKRIAESLKSRLDADQERGKINVFSGFDFREWKSGKKADKSAIKKTVDLAREEYLKDKSHLSPKTILGYRSVIKQLSDFLGQGFYVCKLTDEDIAEFLDQENISLVSKHSYLKTIKAFCSWLEKKQFIKSNPAKEVNLPKSPDDLANIIIDEEDLNYLLAIHHGYISDHKKNGHINDPEKEQAWFSYLVKFAFYTGLRRQEIVNIKWGHIDLKNKLIHVVDGKGAKSRSVIILKSLYPILKKWKELSNSRDTRYVFESINSTRSFSKKKHPENVSKAFKVIVKESELCEDIRFHSLRHSYATHMLNIGFQIIYIKELMGHSSIKTTLRYTHLVPQSILKFAKQHGKA